MDLYYSEHQSIRYNFVITSVTYLNLIGQLRFMIHVSSPYQVIKDYKEYELVLEVTTKTSFIYESNNNRCLVISDQMIEMSTNRRLFSHKLGYKMNNHQPYSTPGRVFVPTQIFKLGRASGTSSVGLSCPSVRIKFCRKN